MKDSALVDRGSCKKPGCVCEEYMPPDNNTSFKCLFCGHYPGCHVNVQMAAILALARAINSTTSSLDATGDASQPSGVCDGCDERDEDPLKPRAIKRPVDRKHWRIRIPPSTPRFLKENKSSSSAAPSQPSVLSEKDKALMSDLTKLVADIQVGDPSAQLAAVTKIRLLVSREANPPIEVVLQSGALPYLVRFLSSNDPKIQLESSWAITNIASGESQHTQQVIDSGAVEPLMRLIQSEDTNLALQAMWGLGNISGNGA